MGFTMNKILVTGAAGFIGYFLSKSLLDDGHIVVGVDNLNDYYDVQLKKTRLSKLLECENFRFVEADISDKETIDNLFERECFEVVVNLAAQAGVRYSITNPDVYIQSNIVGFYNVLEACRYHPVKHLVYASSSSVYGNQEKVPFSTEDDVSKPISLYAATKKTNELMAYTYSHLYKIPTTGLRFFTVYGPMGRPDMAYFGFTNKMVKGESIQVFNNGDLRRDFTYVDDIVTGIRKLISLPPKGDVPADVFNIGNNKPENLLHFIEVLESCLVSEGIIDSPAKLEFLPMQKGDVYQTYADVTPLIDKVGFKPSTTIEEGLSRFAKWYKEYYRL